MYHVHAVLAQRARRVRARPDGRLDGHPCAPGRSQRASEEGAARLRLSEGLPCLCRVGRERARRPTPAATPLCRTAATPLTAPCCLQATGALVHENADGTTAPVHGAAEAYLAEFRDKVGKGELTYEDGWVEVTK